MLAQRERRGQRQLQLDREDAAAFYPCCKVICSAYSHKPIMGIRTSKPGELLQGTLDMLILKTLARDALHGYAIAESIHQYSEDALRVEEGALYPALHRLELRGWLASEWGTSENNRRAKYYRLTAAGRRQLAVESEHWERMAAAIGRILAVP